MPFHSTTPPCCSVLQIPSHVSNKIYSSKFYDYCKDPAVQYFYDKLIGNGMLDSTATTMEPEASSSSSEPGTTAIVVRDGGGGVGGAAKRRSIEIAQVVAAFSSSTSPPSPTAVAATKKKRAADAKSAELKAKGNKIGLIRDLETEVETLTKKIHENTGDSEEEKEKTARWTKRLKKYEAELDVLDRDSEDED